jgi:hypothetical protein
MQGKVSCDYAPLKPGAHVLLQADPTGDHHRRYLRELAQSIDLGGMTIATRSRLPVGSLVRLKLYAADAADDESPLRAMALVRWRHGWFGQRLTALQFLEFEGLGSRSLERCLGTVLAATHPPSRRPAAGASAGRRWRSTLFHLLHAIGPTSRSQPAASLRAAGSRDRQPLRILP